MQSRADLLFLLFCSEKSEFYFGMLYVYLGSILKRVERPKGIVTEVTIWFTGLYVIAWFSGVKKA